MRHQPFFHLQNIFFPNLMSCKLYDMSPYIAFAYELNNDKIRVPHINFLSIKYWLIYPMVIRF